MLTGGNLPLLPSNNLREQRQEVRQPPRKAKVSFRLPEDHRESPPRATRYRTVLRKLTDSTTTQLRIDGVSRNPVVLLENRPVYMILQAEEAAPGRQTPGGNDPRHATARGAPALPLRHAQPPPSSSGHGEPLSLQSPAFRKPANADKNERASSSTDPARLHENEEPPSPRSVPSDIYDLEVMAEQAAQKGEVPTWQVTGTDRGNLMQSTIRMGANTQDISWIWGATPSTLPPTFPLSPLSVVSLRGAADGSWRGVVWQPQHGRATFHPLRQRHEPTVVVFNTLKSHRDNLGTLPLGARLTLTPVGSWMGVTRINLGTARTPNFWLVFIDAVGEKEQPQRTIPLSAGDTFWLAWSSDGVWSRKARFPGDIAHLGGPSVFPRNRPPRPPTPPHRHDGGSSSQPTEFNNNNQQQPQNQPQPLPRDPPPRPAEARRDPRPQQSGQPRPNTATSARNPQRRHAPSPGSEPETSWPSDDEDDFDNNILMQTGGRASSSTDPAPRTDEEDFGTLLDNLDNLLQALLQQSFQQPRGEVTDLAYRACSSLAALRRARAREEHAPHVDLTTPDSDTDFPTNPLAEAQVTLRRLALHHNDMTTGQLRGALYPLQDILSQTRRLVDRLGTPPHPAHWHEALAGLRNVANEAEATGLAVEEGGVASTHMAITALLAAVDRTSAYLDRMLADAAHRDEADKPRKRKQEELATRQTNRQLRARDDRPPRALPQPPALPVPSDGPAVHVSRVPPGQPSSSTQRHTGEATPYQILRAQQILEKLMPFLDQQAAAMLSEAHALLFGWTTALWGRPILLVDTEGTNPSSDELPNPTMTNEAESLPAEFAAEADSSLQPTQTFWPPSPTGEPAGGTHVLTRQTSHRRRRMHALFADEDDTNDLEHDGDTGRSRTDDLH